MGIFSMGNLGRFPRWKAAATESRYPTLITSLVCAAFLCDHTTGCKAYSFTTDGYGIFNVRTNLGAYRSHEGGSGTNKSAQELIRRDRKTAAHPAPPGDRNPRSLDLNSDSLTSTS